jgi:hypothetical protein
VPSARRRHLPRDRDGRSRSGPEDRRPHHAAGALSSGTGLAISVGGLRHALSGPRAVMATSLSPLLAERGNACYELTGEPRQAGGAHATVPSSMTCRSSARRKEIGEQRAPSVHVLFSVIAAGQPARRRLSTWRLHRPTGNFRMCLGSARSTASRARPPRATSTTYGSRFSRGREILPRTNRPHSARLAAAARSPLDPQVFSRISTLLEDRPTLRAHCEGSREQQRVESLVQTMASTPTFRRSRGLRAAQRDPGLRYTSRQKQSGDPDRTPPA